MEKEKQLDPGETESLKAVLAKQVDGLYFMSETDSLIDVVTFTGIQDIKPKLLAESTEPQPVLTELNFDEFLAKYATEQDWYNSIQKNFAGKFGDALRLMKDRLGEIEVFRVGGVRAIIYIIGKTSASDWLGLKTLVVET